MNARTTGTMLYFLAGAFGLAAGGTAGDFSRLEATPTPILDFFYVIHIHVPNDSQLPSPTEFNDIAHTVSRLADVLEAHGARGTFEAVYMFADAARLYQGAGNNILTQLVARGHEVAAHAHNGNMFQLGYTALLNTGVQNVSTVGGRTAIPGNATTFADTVQLAADVGFTVLTDNWSPTDTFGGATWCTDFGLGGNTMYTATNNIMHPWRPDYINRDVCAHNPAGRVVNVDHAIPDWLQAGPPPLTDANFNVLKPWFEASLQNLHATQVNAWGFVSHQVEYDYPGTWTVSEDAIAALGRFLTYIDGFVAQGSARYATARDIATRFVQWESTPPTEQPVYVLFNNHVEGDFGMQPGDPACMALVYQTAALPPTGQPNPGPSFALDIVGTELIRNVLDAYTDAASQTPKVFICPAGEFWQTEADPVYGGRLFDTHNYQARGDEFGIQGHGIYYSGQSFCWYNSAHTPEGIQRKLSDLHSFAQQVMNQGQPVNHGLTLTGGSKLEAPAMGTAAAEWSIDHAAFDLGYRISYEDHDGHVEDEPAGINNARASYYLYRGDYGDGVRMWKIDMNGSVTATCGGGTARCETPAEAIARLDAALAARAADPNPRQIYYAAFVIHAGGVWDDYHRAAGGAPMIGEGLGLTTLMDALQARVDAGANLRFVTPAELVGLHVAPGDFDDDGDVDIDDYNQFALCYTGENAGPFAPGCEPGDFDLDLDVGCTDWAQFALVWTGPGQPPQLSQCASQSIPAVSQWGSASLGLLLLAAATLVLRRERSVRSRHGSYLPSWLLILLAVSFGMEGRATAVEPILVLIDLHADPFFGIPTVQQQVFRDWVDATNWTLDTADAHGAKISFLCGGDFAEWVLDDPARGNPLLQRLYASGGQLGTHSHDQVRFATHDWRSLPPNPTSPQALQLWNNHMGQVNAAITAALGVSGGTQLEAINCSRGSHVPSDDAFRLQLMSDFGFTIHEQGPNEEFYSYFPHYPMNPYRPSGANMLQHDPNGPVVLSPFGPVLGKNEVHFGINQDMRTPAVQARFLLELLNWLHDIHVAGTQRVWVTGWASHCHDMLPGTPTRTEFPIVLDWLTTHFVGQPVGGNIAARFTGVPAARDAYLAWEAAHPGEVSFSYDASTTDWNQYPYLVPAVRYLTEAWYEEAMSAVGAVRWHRMTASAGGPYSLYVAYTTDGMAATVDLSAALGAGEIAAVNPASGAARRYPTTSVTVATVGTILVPPNKLMVFQGTGDFEPDGDVDLTDFAQFEICFTGPGGTLAAGCEPGDFNRDADVDCTDWDAFVLAWTDLGQPPEFAPCAPAIPALSEWGVMVMILALLAVGTLLLRCRIQPRRPTD